MYLKNVIDKKITIEKMVSYVIYIKIYNSNTFISKYKMLSLLFISFLCKYNIHSLTLYFFSFYMSSVDIITMIVFMYLLLIILRYQILSGKNYNLFWNWCPKRIKPISFSYFILSNIARFKVLYRIYRLVSGRKHEGHITICK